jgi:hypothetical protein
VLDADPSVHRALKQGMSGADVRALQLAVDGVFTSEIDRGAAWAAFILGIGGSQDQILEGSLSEQVQARIRDPRKRNALQKRRAVGRRRVHCREDN